MWADREGIFGCKHPSRPLHKEASDPADPKAEEGMAAAATSCGAETSAAAGTEEISGRDVVGRGDPREVGAFGLGVEDPDLPESCVVPGWGRPPPAGRRRHCSFRIS